MAKAVKNAYGLLPNTQHETAVQLALTFPLRTQKRGRPLKDAEKIQLALQANVGPIDDHHARVDVVGDKLCDDILSYLSPSLEEYKGCTIIDVNPGACMWSRKVHDFLKPKRHLLMEPESKYFKPFIKPLLDLPDSNYRFSPLHGAHPTEYWPNYQKVLENPDLIDPPRTSLPVTDPARRQIDTSILLIGNLARRFPSPGARTVPFPSLILQHMTWAGITNSIIHNAGLVRQLWWLPDHNLPIIFPLGVNNTSALNTGLRFGAQVTHVAGPRNVNHTLKKDPERFGYWRFRAGVLERTVMDRVQERMQAASITPPPGRALLTLDIPPPSIPVTPRSPLEERYTTLAEFHAALAKLESCWTELVTVCKRDSRVRSKLPAATTAKLQQMVSSTLEYPQLMNPYDSHGKGPPSQMRVQLARDMLYLDAHFQLINLEVHYHVLSAHDIDMSSYKPRLLALSAEIHEWPRSGRKFNLDVIQVIHEHLVVFSRASPLAMDLRPYEPLQADITDFHPRVAALALLDVVPSTITFDLDDLASRNEVLITAQELIKFLFMFRASTVQAALDHIAPNAARDLIPHIPHLHDPRYGGRLDPNVVVVRMLTNDMLEQLIRAWFEWPFRPPFGSLAMMTVSHGSSSRRDVEADEPEQDGDEAGDDSAE